MERSKRLAIIIAIGVILIVVITVTVVVIKKNNKDVSKDSDDTKFAAVTTVCGQIQGKINKVKADDGKQTTVYTFKNIPYAEPPVKDLRWRPPVPLSQSRNNCWSGTRKYNNEAVVCKQNFAPGPLLDIPSNKSKEDCLVLHVRTPSLNKSSSLPVLFWIHGGGMLVGYGDQKGYHPDNQLTTSMNIVSVSINYRLGLFGFLSLEELWETSPNPSYANFGIMDQILALKWVKENIKNFGGDPNKVTIFGESGGGTAVYSLIASTPARGLFSQAIPASGAPSITTTYQESNMFYRDFVNKTGCDRPTLVERKQCLKNLSSNQILKYRVTKLKTYPWVFPFNQPNTGFPLEVLDPVVIQNSPGKLPSDVGNALNILMTNTAQEIGYKTPIKTYDELKTILQPRMDSFAPNLYPKILQMYRNDSDKILPTTLTPDYLYETMTTDVLITCTLNEVAENLSSIQNYNVYRGVLSQPPDNSSLYGKKYAFHAWDSVILFLSDQENSPGNDLMLRTNIRKIYKTFLHSSKSFETAYKNKPFVLWNNTILTLSHDYHKNECEEWSKSGFLKNAWGRKG